MPVLHTHFGRAARVAAILLTAGVTACGRYAARVWTLLEKSTIRGSELSEDERLMFSLSPDFDLGVKLTSDDRRMIRSFLLPALKF